ncbi:MAG: STAS domain-containing protein [Calditrichaeota bacterium]|nr:STAS domain-containing protein [Calditrichota bacterium]
MEGIQLSVAKTGSRNNISVIKVGGYIDTTTSSELEHALNTLLKAGSYNIIIDLGNVDYVSSAGWGIFISEIKGIRENGGDLKLVRMIPEVYEVFELLEFHFILKAFDSLEEAIQDFERTLSEGSQPQIVELDANLGQKSALKESSVQSPEKMKFSTGADVSLDEKVKKIIVSHPSDSTIQIARTLNTPAFGNIKIGWFGLRKVLKKLGLDSKKKRRKLSEASRI